MQTPRNALIEDQPCDSLTQIAQALAGLTDHLSMRADLEHETGQANTAEVFDGLCHHVRLIKEAVEFEAMRLYEQHHELDFAAWARNFPAQFPEALDHEHPYRNPFIRHAQRETYDAVRSGFQFLEEAVSPSSLSPAGNLGHYRVMQCLSGALVFEASYRAQEGFGLVVEPQACDGR